MAKFLLMYSNPKGTEKLKLDQEIRQIQDDLEWCQVPNISFEAMGFVKKTDIQRKFASYKPDIVQFSGHGTIEGAIVIEDENNKPSIVPQLVLKNIFQNFNDTIKCVVLNSCYSELQAKEIKKHIPFVVGITQEVEDTAAKFFSSKFFQSLVLGNSIQKSFDIAKTEISLIAERYGELPKLIYKKNFDPQKTYLIPKPEIQAKFELSSRGTPIKVDGLFKMKVSIKNAPVGTFVVLYQYIEDEWDVSEQVEECRNVKNEFADNLSEDGDIEIRAVIWNTNGGIAIRSNLADALQIFYCGKMSKNVNEAFIKIKQNN